MERYGSTEEGHVVIRIVSMVIPKEGITDHGKTWLYRRKACCDTDS